MLAFLIAAHVIGDFLLQNHWMQAKSRNSWVCTVHVLAYSLPFCGLALAGRLPVWALCFILIQHWLQDRFSLHMKWMKIYRQSPVELWPVGPLCIDQSMHVAFIALVCAFLRN